jgi:hypothetical protein
LGIEVSVGCLQWLEDTHPTIKCIDENDVTYVKSRTDEILELGRYIPSYLFERFLESRPHLSWMHSIQTGDYDLAANHAAKFALGDAHSVMPAESVQSIMSIAKLCCIAGIRKDYGVERESELKKTLLVVEKTLLETACQEVLMKVQSNILGTEVQKLIPKFSSSSLISDMLAVFEQQLALDVNFPYSDKFDFICKVLALLSEQITANQDNDEEINFEISGYLFRLWVAVVIADWPLFQRLIQDEQEGVPSGMIEKYLLGNEASSGSLLLYLNQSNYEEVAAGRLESQVLLLDPVSDAMRSSLNGADFIVSVSLKVCEQMTQVTAENSYPYVEKLVRKCLEISRADCAS